MQCSKSGFPWWVEIRFPFLSNTLNNWMLKYNINFQWIGIYPRGLSCRYYLSTKVGFDCDLFCLIVISDLTQGVSHPALCWPALLGGFQCGRKKVRGIGLLSGKTFRNLDIGEQCHCCEVRNLAIEDVWLCDLDSPLNLLSLGARVGDWSRELSVWLGSPLRWGRRVLSSYRSFLWDW